MRSRVDVRRGSHASFLFKENLSIYRISALRQQRAMRRQQQQAAAMRQAQQLLANMRGRGASRGGRFARGAMSGGGGRQQMDNFIRK